MSISNGNVIVTYTKEDMVSPAHIKVIADQLKKFGSKVPNEVLKDGQEHTLANVLRLECCKETFRNVSLKDINSIGNQEFNLSYIL